MRTMRTNFVNVFNLSKLMNFATRNVSKAPDCFAAALTSWMRWWRGTMTRFAPSPLPTASAALLAPFGRKRAQTRIEKR